MTTRTEHDAASVVSQLRGAVYPAVLGDHTFGTDDDFFEAGGDSIELMRLLAIAQQHFDVDLDVREFFDRPTMSHLAELIGHQLDDRFEESR